MYSLKKSCYLFFIITFVYFSFACTSNKESKSEEPPILVDSISVSVPEQEKMPNSEINVKVENDTISVVLVPCSNGYTYRTKGFDLNPLIEKRLKEEEIEVQPFPFKKMKGSGYHGVFSKKHCSKILKMTNADFVIMTRMKGVLGAFDDAKNSWGYATKILSRKTLEEVKSISASKLENYDDIDPHIEKNISILIRQLESLK